MLVSRVPDPARLCVGLRIPLSTDPRQRRRQLPARPREHDLPEGRHQRGREFCLHRAPRPCSPSRQPAAAAACMHSSGRGRPETRAVTARWNICPRWQHTSARRGGRSTACQRHDGAIRNDCMQHTQRARGADGSDSGLCLFGSALLAVGSAPQRIGRSSGFAGAQEQRVNPASGDAQGAQNVRPGDSARRSRRGWHGHTPLLPRPSLAVLAVTVLRSCGAQGKLTSRARRRQRGGAFHPLVPSFAAPLLSRGAKSARSHRAIGEHRSVAAVGLRGRCWWELFECTTSANKQPVLHTTTLTTDDASGPKPGMSHGCRQTKSSTANTTATFASTPTSPTT